MDLALNEDQRQIVDFLDGLTRPYASVPMHDCSLALVSDELDAELAEGGFLDVMAMEELGPVTAALVIERLARLPFAVEAGASALLRIALDPDLPRPLCLVEEGRLGRPVRYLKAGATVVVVGAGGVKTFTASAAQVRAVTDEPIYAYPLAYLTEVPGDARLHDMAPAEALRLWRVGVAAEAAGLLTAALDSVKTYTSERKQFGRPIATFQALRHRMAETQVLTNAAYWLALRAAGTRDEGDAALAVSHALDTAKRVGYDFHQFMGAMGMTLEHPLHLWTYRLKFLTGELGGRGANAAAAAEAIWG
jgi:alkylation response protein AidB-like acyl-CoA dehydrogenase